MGGVIGIGLGIFIAITFMLIPIIKILRARYISLQEKLIWFLISILWLPITYIMDLSYSQAIKNATSQEEYYQLVAAHNESSFSGSITVFFPLLVFLIFKLVYTRRQAIWEIENNKTTKAK